MPKEAYTKMWTAALPGIAKAICYSRQKQMGMWEWLNRLWYIYTVAHSAAQALLALCLHQSPGKLLKDINAWTFFPEILISLVWTPCFKTPRAVRLITIDLW